jgi:hypothetical protein
MTHRWVQLWRSQALDLQEKGEIIKNTGFSLVDSLGHQMASNNSASGSEITAPLIENIVKQFTTH